MLSRAQNTFHHNPRLRGPVSSRIYTANLYCVMGFKLIEKLFLYTFIKKK